MEKSVRKPRFCQDFIPNHIRMRYQNTNKTVQLVLWPFWRSIKVTCRTVWKESGTLPFKGTLLHFLPAVLFLKEFMWICNMRVEAQIYSFPRGKASPWQPKGCQAACMHTYSQMLLILFSCTPVLLLKISHLSRICFSIVSLVLKIAGHTQGKQLKSLCHLVYSNIMSHHCFFQQFFLSDQLATV